MASQARSDFILGLVIIALAVAGTFVFIPNGIVLPDDIETRALSPDFWPLTIMILLGISGIALLLQARLAGSPEADEREQAMMRPFGEGLFRVGLLIIWLLLMYLLIPQLGMAVSCAITFIAMTIFAGERRWKYILPIAVILPLVLYLFFVYVANVPLPVGVFEAWK